jgi:hypothetical protein
VRTAAALLVILAVSVGLSYLLAMAGEPQSVWLWGLFR